MAWILVVSTLLGCAKKAAERSGEDPSEALVAIAFATAAFEGCLNEFGQFLRLRLTRQAHETQQDVIALSGILGKLEESHAALDLKLAVMDAVLGNDVWSTSKQPMQDLMLLVRLRNSVLHPRPFTFYQAADELPERPDKIVAALVARGIIDEPPMMPLIPTPEPTSLESYAPWVTAIQTPKVARWALDTVARCMVAFAQSFPEEAPIRGELEKFLASAYRLEWNNHVGGDGLSNREDR